MEQYLVRVALVEVQLLETVIVAAHKVSKLVVQVARRFKSQTL
jgi:hypothetical protein